MTKILGKPVATAYQMATYLLSVNPSPKFSRNITALEFCQLFLDIAAKEGVRGDLQFAQSCKETGNFTYGGDVHYTQNNFAGIGATGGVSGCTFSSIEIGILAGTQHLKSYATKENLNEPNVDPRRTTWFMNTKGGTSPNIETLGGTWAVPGYNTKKYSSLAQANSAKDSYGYQIVNILNDILKIKEKEENTMEYTNSPLVSYTKISPNSTNPRNHVIDTITIHCFVGQVTVQRGCEVFNAARKASCNYVVAKDGQIGLVVDEANRSWCSSNSANDHRAITIEVASDTTAPYAVTDAAFNSLIKLCADICKRNNIKKLIWSNNKAYRVGHINGCNMTVHRDYAAKSCPGQYLYERHGLIAEKVNKLLGASTSNSTITPTPSITRSYLMKGNKGEEVKTLQENLNYLGFSCGNIDGDFGTKTETALKKFQTSYRLTVDGKYGEKSKTALEKAVTDKKSSMSTVTQTDSNLNYNLVFNATYYANKYADLKKAFGTNATQLLQHFKQYGMAEGRQAIDSFCVQNYKNRYPDLQKAFGNDLKKYYEHYMNYGYRENRNGR